MLDPTCCYPGRLKASCLRITVGSKMIDFCQVFSNSCPPQMSKHPWYFSASSADSEFVDFWNLILSPAGHSPSTGVLRYHNPSMDVPSSQKVTSSQVTGRPVQGWENGDLVQRGGASVCCFAIFHNPCLTYHWLVCHLGKQKGRWGLGKNRIRSWVGF